MVKEIKWTKEAEETFHKVIIYLEKNWSEQEVSAFIIATNNTVNYISRNPLMFRKINKNNVREALITPHNLLIYKVYPTHVTLITFWDTRQYPRKKRKKQN